MTKADTPQEHPHERRQWHFDKSISVGHILTTVTIAVSVFFWAMRMDTRISLLEQSSVRQIEVDRQQDRNLEIQASGTREDLRLINAKLDRIIESGLRR